MHPYELYLELNEIEHTRTKVRHPQTNGICERFHPTVQNEIYRVAFRKRIYETLEHLQTDLDECLKGYNEQRTHQGIRCQGRTPMQTFEAGQALAHDERIYPMTEPSRPAPRMGSEACNSSEAPVLAAAGANM